MITAEVLPDHQKMEKQMQKQMGCMAGFFQIFDRQQFLAGKRVYATTKRLPAISPPEDAKLQAESSVAKQPPECVKSRPPPPPPPPPGICNPTPQKESTEIMKSTWKFRETPRLSLDSRVVVDVKGSLHPREIRTKAAISSSTEEEEEENEKQRRSPSVVARLMGLEALPDSTREPLKKPELRRSSSESRSRDLLQYRFVDGNGFHNAMRETQRAEVKTSNIMEKKSNLNSQSWKLQHHQQRKNTQDFFPEPKQKESLFGELEKRLKRKGITEPAEDLETLKQILEALQLKGLLHSSQKRHPTTGNRNRNRNFVFDSEFSYPEITHSVSMKPSNSPRTIGNHTPPSNLRSKSGTRQNNAKLPPVRRRLDRCFNDNESRYSSSMSPDRSDSNATKSPCSPARRKLITAETQGRRRNNLVDQRRNCSPVHSPRIKNGSDQSPRTYRRSAVDISSPESSISESSNSAFSQVGTKSRRLNREDHKEGRNCILARCDKLLNSISELTTTDSQPSPVSVLDSSQLSPVQYRVNDKDISNELEEGMWSPTVSPVRIKSYDADFVYVSEIIEASNHNKYGELDLFCLLEKQRYKPNSSNESRLHRQLVFDTVTEILERKKQLPAWNAASDIGHITGKPSTEHIWPEFSKIREPFKAEGVFETICGVLQKDLAHETTNGFAGNCTMETSEMVLDIERMIFKDLIGDTIQDLATFTGKSRGLAPKRLVY